MAAAFDFWLGQPWALVSLLALFGLLVGSFLNVVIHRLPKMLEADWRAECAEFLGQAPPETPRYDLMVPRSACPACGTTIAARHNVPVLSYLFLRGRCGACRAPIGARYPLVELLTAALFALLGWYFGPGVQLAGGLVLTAALIALTFIDADTQLLPDSLTLPLLWAGLLFHLVTGTLPLADALWGAIAGYLSLWSVYWLFRLVTGKEGMGFGDFKLLAALGAWLGWTMLPLVILLSSLVGALVGVVLIALSRHGRGQPLPFGPYLAAAGWIAYVWGGDIVRWYLNGA
ncbi:prepilin peptidase [Crenobacter luteus]|uniref:Prepilin leader peptidase/N-methyltransferase n=1 Tax=Crenobacter luteus TaxID=1452487 RepID=A0A161SFL5_9NEIS|nr:A24 family peptidase [Crenobacter luteus]KZE31509.1 methyltransferase [Crenobacter luteus]